MTSPAQITSSSPSNLVLVDTSKLCETCAAQILPAGHGHNSDSNSSSNNNNNNNNNNHYHHHHNNNNSEGIEPSTSTFTPPETSEASSSVSAPAPAPTATTEDIVQLIMISELRSAEEKLEQGHADLEVARRAFNHERRGVLASMRNAREALRVATDGYWQNTHDLSVAMTVFRREKHEFENAKAALEEARAALNTEREAFEAEVQAANTRGERRRKIWRRLTGWLGRQ
ncbi:hypothetical protein A1O7_05319 [Cladophialophora yegresii CBS 114405]|uniref:Uncharacterized protein n=1 Tax=Cladophialophora yegresii CBS 114405 TaxID=1182544 RepID=W9W072_9EURO|nr:uncharacterized protein A1O7_05319 [Cladophialophora yegresii CBS 114405]EXJ57896.1 hypothetical protein A1O7_05319 [Cladophialophora yegresii CBS 114405]